MAGPETIDLKQGSNNTAKNAASIAEAGASLAATAQQVREAEKNRDFQASMSNSAVYRRMLDLRKAGINPILAGQGMGASTPSGGQAQITNPLKGFSQNISSAKMARIAQRKSVAEINSLDQSAHSANAVEKLTDEKAETEKVNRTLMQFQTNSAKAESDFWKKMEVTGAGKSGLSTGLQLLKMITK